jgi:hypothetical protein
LFSLAFGGAANNEIKKACREPYWQCHKEQGSSYFPAQNSTRPA